MRTLTLLALCCFLVLPAAEWSGRIVVEESLRRPEASAALKVELDAFIERMQKRLDIVKAELAVANAAERKVLLQDLANFRGEIMRARRERGGLVRLGSREYRLASEAILMLSEDSALLVNRNAQRAEVVVDGQRRGVKPVVASPVALEAAQGPQHFTYGSRVHNLAVDGVTYRVEVVSELPNPYAKALIEGADSGVVQALATLPGLPALAVGMRSDGEHCLCVTAVEARPWIAAELSLPAGP